MRVLDVLELTAYIKDLLDSDPILSDVWVRGEISSFSRSAAGHIYFNLKADGAQLKCVLFRGNARWVTFTPGNGDAVVAHGRVSLYEVSGQYQLYVDLLQPEGTGTLQLQFEELRQRLDREGLFDPSRKRTLPRCPQHVGVVTSPTGAVWHDIQNVLERRYPLCELILAPSLVQGDEAPEAIVRALEALALDGRPDVIVVARGGGSMEDLWCFNDERVARAVFACPIPVVSAVGHETDVTICDLVADVRAPTPSAAAEIVAPHARELQGEVLDILSRAEAAMREIIREKRDAHAFIAGRLYQRSPVSRLHQQRLVLDGQADRLQRAMEGRLATERTRGEHFGRQLALLHPQQIMERGYAMVLDGVSGGRVHDAAALHLDQDVVLHFHDGAAGATITASPTSAKGRSHVDHQA